jgi:ribosomal protein L34E
MTVESVTAEFPALRRIESPAQKARHPEAPNGNIVSDYPEKDGYFDHCADAQLDLPSVARSKLRSNAPEALYHR